MPLRSPQCSWSTNRSRFASVQATRRLENKCPASFPMQGIRRCRASRHWSRSERSVGLLRSMLQSHLFEHTTAVFRLECECEFYLITPPRNGSWTSDVSPQRRWIILTYAKAPPCELQTIRETELIPRVSKCLSNLCSLKWTKPSEEATQVV